MPIKKGLWNTCILNTTVDVTADYVTITEHQFWDVVIKNNGVGTVTIQRGYQGADDTVIWEDMQSFSNDDGVLSITEPCQAIRAKVSGVSGAPTIKAYLQRLQG